VQPITLCFCNFSAAFKSFGHFARWPFKIVYQPAATCSGTRCLYFHLYFSFNDGAEIFIAKWFTFHQPAGEKMRKSGRKKHFDMQMLKASCGDYDIENN